MANYKTVPNQKVVQVKKEVCNKDNLYAAINLQAMESAAQILKAGAFKLWVYFAKNQNNYEFALSNKEVAENFGIKKDQYDTAVKELIANGYLKENGGNHYIFYEVPQQEKTTTEEINNFPLQEKTTTSCGKNPQGVVGKNHNQQWEKTTRNITNNTLNTTFNNTFGVCGKPQTIERKYNKPVSMADIGF